MGQVAFNRTPGNIRVPFWYAEVNSGVSYFAGNSKHLIIGQKLAGGTAAAGVPQIVQQQNVRQLFGAGSMLEAQIRVAAYNNPLGEIWALPLADPAGTAGVKTVTLAGAPTPGLVTLYALGQPVTVSVASTDTLAMIAANLAAALNAGYTNLQGQGVLFPFTAAASGAVITCIALHIGAVASQFSFDVGLIGNEGPNNALMTVATATAGTGIPALSGPLAACGATEFDMISMPYADATSLNTMQAFLSDSGGRWDPTVQLYGHCFTVNVGNLSAQSTLGATRNDQHTSIMGVQSSPTPPWIWAAAIGAQVQLHKNMGDDLTEAGEISRPMQTLVLQGVQPPQTPPLAWAMSDRNTLYYDGISGFTVTRDGQVALDRLISTYQTNAWGSVDTTWLDVETLYQTTFALRFMKQQITQKHPRDALVPDNPGALQGFTTPNDLKADIIHAYALLVQAGVMKNLQLFADNVVVEQGADPNRVNAFLPLDVVNQLRIFAANATTYLNAATV